MQKQMNFFVKNMFLWVFGVAYHDESDISTLVIQLEASVPRYLYQLFF